MKCFSPVNNYKPQSLKSAFNFYVNLSQAVILVRKREAPFANPLSNCGPVLFVFEATNSVRIFVLATVFPF